MMASYVIKVRATAANIRQLQAKLESVGLSVPEATVQKVERNPSRADQLAEAETLVDEARGIIQGLKEGLEEWKSNMPESLQNGDKASEIDDAMSQLDELETGLDNLDFNSVDFPGAY
jgi:hypothetical protein